MSDAATVADPAVEKIETEKTATAAPPSKPSLLSQVIRGKIHQPPRIVFYGVHGIGKSSVAANSPSPIFLCTEEGANEIDVPKLPDLKSRSDVMDALRALYKEPHDYKTVVLDSADWLEDFIILEAMKEYTDKELAFGRDSLIAEGKFNDVLGAFNLLRMKRDMAVIIIAHSEIKRFNSPMTEPFDRYQPKLGTRVSAITQEWADAVFFINYDVAVKKEDVGFNRSVKRGVSSGERIIYTEERPAYYAKNRYGMPEELPLDWAKVAECIPYYKEKK